MAAATLAVSDDPVAEAGATASRRVLVEWLQKRGVRDEAVLQAMRDTPRHRFVHPEMVDYAYFDDVLPIGFEQTISQPYVVGLMTQLLLEPKVPRTVLEVGTGSGYQAAILARLVPQVYSVERIPELHELSTQRFRDLGLDNISTRLGDGGEGWQEHAPFDAAILTAATSTPPRAIVAQLAEGGCLLMPEGPHYRTQTLVRYTRTAESLAREEFLDVRFVPMISEAD